MCECVEVETINAEEVAGVDGVESDSVSNRCRGDQEIHRACSLAPPSPPEGDKSRTETFISADRITERETPATVLVCMYEAHHNNNPR